MKEFIYKLIERLEEAKESAKRRNAFDSEVSYACAIDIVNKLAEEFATDINVGTKVSEMPTGSEDCCEWRKGTSGVFPIKTSCGNSVDVNYGYEFCPYCGKKIKVAPYTEGE